MAVPCLAQLTRGWAGPEDPSWSPFSLGMEQLTHPPGLGLFPKLCGTGLRGRMLHSPWIKKRVQNDRNEIFMDGQPGFFLFLPFAFLAAAPVQMPVTPQLFLNSEPGSDRQERTRRCRSTTQPNWSHLHFWGEEERRRHRHSQREGEMKDHGTGRRFIFRFNSRGI